MSKAIAKSDDQANKTDVVCKHCSCELDGDDILQSLSDNKAYAHYTPEQLVEIASMFGWTPENKKCFTKDIRIRHLTPSQEIFATPRKT